MTTVISRRRVTLIQLLVIAVLILVLVVEYLIATSDATADEKAAVTDDVSPAVSSGDRYTAPDIVDFVEILERPVFFPDRKLPPEPELETVVAEPPQPLRLRLEGVAISGENRVAVLRITSSNQLLRLAEGESHDGWLLESVDADRAVFKRDAEVAELFLDTEGGNTRR